jgi:hypothetical protein
MKPQTKLITLAYPNKPMVLSTLSIPPLISLENFAEIKPIKETVMSAMGIESVKISNAYPSDT